MCLSRLEFTSKQCHQMTSIAAVRLVHDQRIPDRRMVRIGCDRHPFRRESLRVGLTFKP
jgi:hypothetical protein